jgi:steroid 5-alpha reductase family enzyme
MDPFLITSLVVTLIAFTAIWLIHVPLEDAGLVDYYWGPGFAVIGWTGLAFGAESSGAKLLLLGAITLWALRLAIQLIMRHRLMEGEDGRYLKMRQNGGPQWWWRSLYKVFLLQAVILWLVATPVHAIVGASARQAFRCSDTPDWPCFWAVWRSKPRPTGSSTGTGWKAGREVRR